MRVIRTGTRAYGGVPWHHHAALVVRARRGPQSWVAAPHRFQTAAVSFDGGRRSAGRAGGAGGRRVGWQPPWLPAVRGGNEDCPVACAKRTHHKATWCEIRTGGSRARPWCGGWGRACFVGAGVRLLKHALALLCGRSPGHLCDGHERLVFGVGHAGRFGSLKVWGSLACGAAACNPGQTWASPF